MFKVAVTVVVVAVEGGRTRPQTELGWGREMAGEACRGMYSKNIAKTSVRKPSFNYETVILIM